MVGEHHLDLADRHQLAAPAQEVPAPPDEPQVAIGVERAAVAGVHPEVAPIGERVLGAVEVAVGHDVREPGSHPELAFRTRPQRHAVVVDHHGVVPTGELPDEPKRCSSAVVSTVMKPPASVWP